MRRELVKPCLWSERAHSLWTAIKVPLDKTGDLLFPYWRKAFVLIKASTNCCGERALTASSGILSRMEGFREAQLLVWKRLKSKLSSRMINLLSQFFFLDKVFKQLATMESFPDHKTVLKQLTTAQLLKPNLAVSKIFNQIRSYKLFSQLRKSLYSNKIYTNWEKNKLACKVKHLLTSNHYFTKLYMSPSVRVKRTGPGLENVLQQESAKLNLLRWLDRTLFEQNRPSSLGMIVACYIGRSRQLRLVTSGLTNMEGDGEINDPLFTSYFVV